MNRKELQQEWDALEAELAGVASEVVNEFETHSSGDETEDSHPEVGLAKALANEEGLESLLWWADWAVGEWDTHRDPDLEESPYLELERLVRRGYEVSRVAARVH